MRSFHSSHKIVDYERYTVRMLSRYEHHGITWIDLESPTREEVRHLMEEFSLEHLVAEELLLPTIKPRVEIYDRYTYVILHFPALRHTHENTAQEVDFIVGKDFIITTRYDTVDPLHQFSKVFEVNSVLDKTNLGEHAGFVFYYMLKKLYRSIEHELSYLHDSLEDIEQQIYAGHEKEMVFTLSYAGRDLLNLRQAIEPHRDVLKELEVAAVHFFGKPFAPYLCGLLNEYYRVHNHIMRQTEILHELRETNNSLLYTKQNEVMKVLTIMAFVTFPLTLITGLFGMNTAQTPLVEGPYGFWYIVGIMLIAGAIMFAYFKHKRWL